MNISWYASYILPPIIALFTTLILVGIVWRGTRRSPSVVVFCLLLVSLSIESLLVFGMRLSPDVHQALLWEKATPVFLCATFVFFYHFTLVYTENSGQRWFLWVAYVSSLLLAIASPTALIFESMRVESYGYAPNMGPLGVPASSGILILMGVGAYNLIRRYRHSSSHEERNRLLYLIVALLFPLAGTFLDAFSNLPPMAIWGNLIFSLICTIALVKYQLLDINILVRKGLVYLLISTIVALPYVGALLFLNSLLARRVDPWFLHATLILLLAVALRPLYSTSQRIVDRLFQRDKYDHLKALEQFGREAQSIVDLNALSHTTVELVRGALRASSVCLLLPFETDNAFKEVSCVGLDERKSETLLSEASPLIKWLQTNNDAFSLEELNGLSLLQGLSHYDKQSLEYMRAKLIVPIRTRENKLSGILILGSKFSQQLFTSEDKRLLMTLCSQMAMALENARLYEKERSMRQELEQQNDIKTEFLHSVAHELKTPLTAILASSEMFLENLDAGQDLRKRLGTNILNGARSMERRVNELLDSASLQIGEIAVKLERTGIQPIFDEVISQLGILFESREQNINLQMPASLPNVNADRDKLKQILLNLLANANKFSPNGSEIVLRAKEVDHKVVIAIKDKAQLIPDVEKQKIFEPYYRSSSPDKRQRFPGLGLGLAVVKKLVELHDGEIWIESKSGEGNTFAFSLPVLD